MDLDFLTLAPAAGPPKSGVPKPLAPVSGEGVRVPKRPPGAGPTAAPKGVAAPPNPDVPAKQGTRVWVAASFRTRNALLRPNDQAESKWLNNQHTARAYHFDELFFSVLKAPVNISG
mgnify:CR=1 FL=1